MYSRAYYRSYLSYVINSVSPKGFYTTLAYNEEDTWENTWGASAIERRNQQFEDMFMDDDLIDDTDDLESNMEESTETNVENEE